jgi:thiol-disulfide isomerase/thioredoxin
MSDENRQGDGIAPLTFVRAWTANLVVLVGCLAAGFFVAQGVRQTAEGSEGLARDLLKVDSRDAALPPVAITDAQGVLVPSDAFSKGVVLLNFWATWCPPCIDEMPSLLRLGERVQTLSGVRLVTVSVDDTYDDVREFFAGQEPAFSVLHDPEQKAANLLGTTKFPETYVLVDGRIRGLIVGPRDWDAWYVDSYVRSLQSESR